MALLFFPLASLSLAVAASSIGASSCLLSLSLFLSEKFEFDSIGKTHANVFFVLVPDRCANPIWLRASRARARAEEDARRDTNARLRHARTSRTLRAPESPFDVVFSGRSVLFFFLFFLPCFFCARASNGIHRQHIDPSLSLSLSLKYARDEKTEKKKARR